MAEETGWDVVSTNYPVAFAGKESNLDIWIRRGLPGNQVQDVLIECKKANPDFVNWIFFLKNGPGDANQFLFTAATCERYQTHSTDWIPQNKVHRREYPLRVATDAREVRGNYEGCKSDSAKTKTSNAAIQDATYQVALANRSIVFDDFNLLNRVKQSDNNSVPPWKTKFYITMVVTTAKMFVAEFSDTAIDLNSGEIDVGAVSLTPTESVLYRYPMPKHLQHVPEDALYALDGSKLDVICRMDIIIVHANHLSQLLGEIFVE